MGHSRVLRIGVLCVLAAGVVAQGAPLNLVPQTPDIFSAGISISYNAATDAFTATGTAIQYKIPPAAPIAGGTFSLTAQVDENGHASSGLLSITGSTTMRDGTPVSGVLLTADLKEFGFSPDGAVGPPVFEFVSALTGGLLGPDIGPPELLVGTILSCFDPFAGTFQADYQGTQAVADTFAIPEPTSLCLFGAGVLALLRRRQRRRDGKSR